MESGQPELPFYFTADGTRLAYRTRAGAQPTLLFLPGYASDMDGAKALALDAFAARRGLAMVRFDYSGTGASDGDFADGTLDRWLDQSLAAIDQLTAGPVILVGSSMGGWLALHVALRRPDRVRALIGIAAAPDFTDWGFSADQKIMLRRDGRLEEPDSSGESPQLITYAFWQSGEALRLLDESIAVDCPVRLIHGESDSDVPVEIAATLMRQLCSGDVQLNILKGGGHRLSEPHELDAIVRTVDALVEPNR